MIVEYVDWVKKKLKTHPELRDNSCRLYYNYLLESGYDINKPIKELLKDMDSGIIPYIDTIARASRKTQENYPELAGKKRLARLKKAEKVRDEIRKN